jgi:hypothetical protein
MPRIAELLTTLASELAPRGDGSPAPAHIVEIAFRGYKCHQDLVLSLGGTNVLVGANNAGKSTILGALRILEAGMRHARRRKPSRLSTPGSSGYAWSVPVNGLPVSLENVHTDYADDDAFVDFRFGSGAQLTLWFPPDEGCYLYVGDSTGCVRSTTGFKKLFPTTVVTVPVLGPVEHNEPLLAQSTVNRGVGTHRAARHFRNYWYHYPDRFSRFAELVAETWPGMSIEPPELTTTPDGPLLHMFCLENRITREVYWAGFGFQIWCQLLTHLVRAGPHDTLVVDEPETYLHPLIQRRLMQMFRRTGAQVVTATHSAPLVLSAQPSEVVKIVTDSCEGRREGSIGELLAWQLGLRSL